MLGQGLDHCGERLRLTYGMDTSALKLLKFSHSFRLTIPAEVSHSSLKKNSKFTIPTEDAEAYSA
jgi:hypothetical protein